MYTHNFYTSQESLLFNLIIPAVKGKTQNSLINFFSLLIITVSGVYNEMQVGVKFSPLSILRNSRWRPENRKIEENIYYVISF